MARSKKYSQALENVDRDKAYTIEEAVGLLKSFPALKFDQTVEITLNLGIDGRQADQILRGTVMLPHGTGKDIRVLVIAQGEIAQEAEEAGADYVGGADLVAKIEGGWLDFDLVVASPDMMGQVGKLGRVLGPRGLMPNPKTGTVTREVGQAVRDAKAGRVEYRADSKSGNNAQAAIGSSHLKQSRSSITLKHSQRRSCVPSLPPLRGSSSTSAFCLRPWDQESKLIARSWQPKPDSA